ncbi:unnamed protein product [Pleuronectes platessa]|uniref:Uncharacterized protein n=1 Tax=Pleuronectes platessa TaxID=8262 RepID=A0A9N7TR24_PLEPL|nr:unnamed protein product [Pleuronectes platessa]
MKRKSASGSLYAARPLREERVEKPWPFLRGSDLGQGSLACQAASLHIDGRPGHLSGTHINLGAYRHRARRRVGVDSGPITAVNKQQLQEAWHRKHVLKQLLQTPVLFAREKQLQSCYVKGERRRRRRRRRRRKKKKKKEKTGGVKGVHPSRSDNTQSASVGCVDVRVRAPTDRANLHGGPVWGFPKSPSYYDQCNRFSRVNIYSASAISKH